MVAACGGSVGSGSPYTWNSPSQVRMKATSYCTPNVERSDVALALYKWDLNLAAWRLITSNYKSWQPVGIENNVALWGPGCASYARRDWKAQIESYSEYRGEWKAGTASNVRTLYCNFP